MDLSTIAPADVGRLQELGYGTIRTARKPWVCCCHERLWGYSIITTHARADGTPCGSGTKAVPRGTTLAEAEALAVYEVGQPSNLDGTDGFKPVGWVDTAKVVERLNPDHRPECQGIIDAGDTYYEYLGDSGPYQSGDRYCLPCAVAVWLAP